jgi:diguanylate cyclase (GGDEF)-like protein/PAS domain S-box-containing protein
MCKICNDIDIKSLYSSFEHSIDPIAITDSNWEEGIKFIYVNRAFCTQTGYLKEELIGKSPKIFQGEESNKILLQELKEDLQNDKDFIGQGINYKKDGTKYFVKWSISPLKDKNGKTIAYISYQKVLEKIVKFENEKLLSSIVQNSENLIIATDLNGIIVFTNEAFNNTLGYKQDELIGKHSRILKSGKQDKGFYKSMWRSLLRDGVFEGVFESKRKDGSLFYDKKYIKTLKDEDGNSIYYMSISTDISKQKRKEEELKKELYLDNLTNIFNRRKYEEIIDKKILNYKTNDEEFSLILIDIDHFKQINDNYGHDMGDYILKEFAKLIKNNIRDNDMLFRWGGEEFALIIDKKSSDSKILCEKLRLLISTNHFQSIKITASFGISSMLKAKDKKELFINSDKALYKAKNSGRDKVEIYK